MIHAIVANQYDSDGASLHAAMQSKSSYPKILGVLRLKNQFSKRD
jgi:hypothetical protein